MKTALRIAACMGALAVAAIVNAASLRVGSAVSTVKNDTVYRRYWTEQPGVRSGTFGEPLSYVVDGGIVDAGVPVSDGGGFEPAANAHLLAPDPLPTEDFCITVEGNDSETGGTGTAWQYATGDDPIFWQLGEPGGKNSAYLAPTHDGVLYLETCDNSGDWKSWSTTVDTLTWKDATVTACRTKSGDWKLYTCREESGQPRACVEQPTVTDGTGAGIQTVVGLDMVMGAGPGFGYRCVCGDGFVDCLEGCDDGDTTGADGCNASCAVESNYVCAGEPSNCTVICGDGNYDSPEECDDGNEVAADGCANCIIEAGYQCTGWPSTCVTTCGDGTKAGAEECDDGNLIPGDGCDANCVSETQAGAWSGFTTSDYIRTVASNDAYDIAADTGAYTVCFIVEHYATGDDYLFDANNEYSSEWFIRETSSPTVLDVWMGRYNKVRVYDAAYPVPNGMRLAICSGEQRASEQMQMVVSNGTTLASSSAWCSTTNGCQVFGDTGRGTWIGARGYRTAVPDAFYSGKILALAVYHSAATIEYLTERVSDGIADYKFSDDANNTATVICNGSEIGGTCAKGGNVFEIVGSLTFTAF